MNAKRLTLKISFFCIGLAVTFAFIVTAALAQVFVKKGEPTGLELGLKLIDTWGGNVDDLPAEVSFRNRTGDTVRILDLFDTGVSSRVFFSITWFDTNGTPVFSTGGGKISPSKASIKYVELKKDEEFLTKIKLREFLPNKEPLKSGLYEVQITYRNQYGEDCFKGRLESKKIRVVLNH